MSSPMYDLPAHCEMPINKDGQGPETDPERVVDVHCWCGMPKWPCPLADISEDVYLYLHATIMSSYMAAYKRNGPVEPTEFRKYLSYMFESKFGVFIDG